MDALYILPFDHRGSFKKMLLGHGDPITDEERAVLEHNKHVIFAGFKKTVEKMGPEKLGILVDEEFGKDIHQEARALGVRNCLSMEESGGDIFDFEYDDWQDHILEIRPTYAKALIRVKKGEDYSLQNARLKELGDFCANNNIGFLLEPLVQPTDADLEAVDGDRQRFDAEMRPQLFAEAVAELHAAGVYPDVWKIEGTETKEDMDICSEAVFNGGKPEVQIVVLGRGASMEKVDHWLTCGAQSKGVTGFAVGRTIFADALQKLKAGEYTQEQATAQIATNYEHCIEVFEQAKS